MSCVIGHQPALRAIQRYINTSVEPGTAPSIGAIDEWATKISVYRRQFIQDDSQHIDNLCSAVAADSVDSLNRAVRKLSGDLRIGFWFARIPFMYALKENMTRGFIVDQVGLDCRVGARTLVGAGSDAGLPPQKMDQLLRLQPDPEKQRAEFAIQLRELIAENAPSRAMVRLFRMQNQVLETAYDECFRNASHEWRELWLDMACREGRVRLVEFMLGHRYWADVAPSDDLTTRVARGWELYSLTNPQGPVDKKIRPTVRYDDVIHDGDPVLTCFRLIVQHRLHLLQGQQDRRNFRDFMSVLSTDRDLHPEARRIADEAARSLSRRWL
ncbi:Uncharacterized protein PBTT_08173 [Plasmodiophora brassicae]